MDEVQQEERDEAVAAPDGACVPVGADAAASPEGEPSAEDAQHLRARQELAEHNALAMVFDDVRSQSADSELVQPSRWADAGIVPEHMTPDDFEMFVYEYLEDERTARAQAESQQASQPEPVFRTATRAVGVPMLFGAKAAEVAEDMQDESPDQGAQLQQEPADETPGDEPAADASTEAPSPEVSAPEDSRDSEAAAIESSASDNPFANLKIPAGYRLVELEGEYVLMEDENAETVELTVNCERIVTLVGAHSYYLYDGGIMTDAYAHWAFLAAEDNPVVTFADCVREDSRVYPRPLAASSLRNPPFNMSAQAIEDAWATAQESGAYPDIERTVASNGDVYFYSTQYLSAGYAASLAEWDAVERKMNL